MSKVANNTGKSGSLTEDSVSDLSSDGVEAEGVDTNENTTTVNTNGAEIENEPEPATEAGVMKQAFSFIKNHLKTDADMTKLPIPAAFVQPISFLTAIQRQSAIYSNLLLSAPYIKDDLRFLQVLKYHLTWPKMYFPKNPLNPILGEVYECSVDHIDEKTNTVIEGDTTHFIAEQVSHHPPVSCFHFANDKHGIKFDSSEQITPVFKGKCIRVNMKIETCVTLNRGENGSIKETYINHGFTEGYLRLLRWKFEFTGKYTFLCPETGYSAEINFKDKPILGGKWHELQVIVSKNGEKLYDIHGTHIDVLTITNLKDKTSSVFINYNTLRSETVQEIPMDQLKENASQRVWKGVAEGFAKKDSRKAGVEKQKIEDAQRKKAKANLAKDPNFIHKPFHFIPNSNPTEHSPEFIYKKVDPNTIVPLSSPQSSSSSLSNVAVVTTNSTAQLSN